MTSLSRSDRSQPVAIWLFAVALLVLAMVVVGGATRLTGSGLSITEWKPISGVIPPLNQAAWLAEFHNYQRIPQYRYVNQGMSVDAFKAIFWWEWGHRLLGRLLGVVFAVPFVVFLVLKRLPRRLIWPCVILFALGGLQGLVGWWMVKSGLEARVTVAPERLATHLGLALILYSALIWTAWEAWAGEGRAAGPSRWPPIAIGLALLVYLQCLLGALVAGNQAGLVYNDWPLMNGAVFPHAYWSVGLKSLLHSQAAVQFNHRLVAYGLFTCALAAGIAATRSRRLPMQTRWLFVGLAGLVTVQALLGIATLMARAPLGLSAVHQAGAAIVLALATTLAWRVRRA
jgi:cytochrome c oxidase assembly protein subunit 15